ncbi:MAG: hypothetical protein HY708_02740, partial [Ignavibacteriae bacterium]|nr:hypothetical protein [Ignavibacteriota bacterium]
NYDIPHYAEDYVHRIGRTGRAGATGDAVTFVARDEQKHLKKIEQFIGRRFPLKSYQGFTPRQQEPAPVHGRAVASSFAPSFAPSATPHKKKFDKKRYPARRKKNPTEFGRKKKKIRRIDTFSSDTSGAGWSNY